MSKRHLHVKETSGAHLARRLLGGFQGVGAFVGWFQVAGFENLGLFMMLIMEQRAEISLRL